MKFQLDANPTPILVRKDSKSTCEVGMYTSFGVRNDIYDPF